jgi:hypothetical protein
VRGSSRLSTTTRVLVWVRWNHLAHLDSRQIKFGQLRDLTVRRSLAHTLG